MYRFPQIGGQCLHLERRYHHLEFQGFLHQLGTAGSVGLMANFLMREEVLFLYMVDKIALPLLDSKVSFFLQKNHSEELSSSS